MYARGIRLCLPLAAALAAYPAFAALDVEERGGTLAVVRDGRTLVESIVLDCGDTSCDGVKTGFEKTSDGSRVWNRWCEDKDRCFRLEVAARADGAVEITMAGQVAWDSPCRRRAIRLSVPTAALDGKPWRCMFARTQHHAYGEESGVFGAGSKPLRTRFLAVDGLTFDFNAYGPCDEGAVLADGWRHVDAMYGAWRILRGKDGGWTLECGGDVLTSWGGYLGTKLVIREGRFSDYDTLHSVRTFSYNVPFEPLRLLSFGAPLAGRFHSDGETLYSSVRGYGWTGPGYMKRFPVVGHTSGAYYSCVTGAVDSVYRFGPVPDGWYYFTFAAGNFTGFGNRFTVSANGRPVLSDASVGKRTLRKVTVPVHVAGGVLDVSLSGAWAVSVMALQPILLDAEDYSFSRGTWLVDGFEPGLLHRNCDVREPVRPETRDETLDLPVPGTEFAETPRTPPAEVELPPPDLPSLAWTKKARIYRLYNNSSTIGELDAPGALDAYLDREISGRGINAIMLSGMLSRHTFPGQLERGLESVKHVAEVAHRRGMKVIDHWDATLLWNEGEGFRVMTERTAELESSVLGDVPTWQLCIMNPEFRRKLFDYARRDVENGVDGLQIDEVVFWHHGCVCRHCREAFRRDTGWWMPMDETSPAWREGSSFMKRWKAWRIAKSTDFLVDLRRSLKAVKPDLVLSAYTTPNGMFTRYDTLGNGRDIMDLPRAVNFFGIEVMTRSILKSARAELPCHRTTAALTYAYGAPVWNWYFGADWQDDYASWALSEMTAQTPFLAEVDRLPGTPDYPRFSEGMDRAGAKPVAEVALLFSAPSRNWNEGAAVKGDLLGTAQALEAMHIPYAVISEVSLTDAGLAPFRVLFVGASHCMTDAQVAAVRSFAERGGTVRVSTLAGMCDEFGERRQKWPFADVFGFEPRIDCASGELVERPCGKGRMVYSAAPRGEPFEMPSLVQGREYTFAPDPAAEAAFRAEVARWIGDARWWSVSAPDKVYTSVWREKSGALAIHFLNVAGADNKPGEVITPKSPTPAFPPLKDDITFTIPADGPVRAVATSPEFSGRRPLEASLMNDGRAKVVVPASLFSAYLFVRIDGERP